MLSKRVGLYPGRHGFAPLKVAVWSGSCFDTDGDWKSTDDRLKTSRGGVTRDRWVHALLQLLLFLLATKNVFQQVWWHAGFGNLASQVESTRRKWISCGLIRSRLAHLQAATSVTA